MSLWFDSWCGSPLILDDVTPDVVVGHSASIILVNGSWDFSKSSTSILLSLQMRIRNCHILFDLCLDKRCWNLSSHGDLPLKAAYDFKRNKGTLKNY